MWPVSFDFVLIVYSDKDFFLHFAGGNCYSPRFMSKDVDAFELFFIELPGRGHEKLIDDFDLAAADLFKQVRAIVIDNDFIVYGQSMGAYLALRVCGLLEMGGGTAKHLFVSGNAGPGEVTDGKTFELPDSEFIEELISLGGRSTELLNKKEFIDLYLPILCADFRVAEHHIFDEGFKIESPIFALIGSEEFAVSMTESRRRITRSMFGLRIFPGGHFFIYESTRSICQIIRTYND